jgi:tetratricopeptide (TPR) repeat protein
LDGEDDLRLSTANARARIYQAELLLEDGKLLEAIDDVTKSLQLLLSPECVPTSFHTTLLSKAYRIGADAYEQSGNYDAAIQSICCMADANPDLRSKVVKEVERLQQLSSRLQN